MGEQTLKQQARTKMDKTHTVNQQSQQLTCATNNFICFNDAEIIYNDHAKIEIENYSKSKASTMGP